MHIMGKDLYFLTPGSKSINELSISALLLKKVLDNFIS